MKKGWPLALALGGLFAIGGLLFSQVIEFDSGGRHYLAMTRNGVTVMFANMPVTVREYAVVQVSVSNGSGRTWNVRPEDFRFQRSDGTVIPAMPAQSVVSEFIERGGRADVVKLVNVYEAGLYGIKTQSTNGYQSRREAALNALSNPRLKAAAAASAIVLVATRLKPGDSTDGAIFYSNAAKALGPGKLIVETGGSVFEFETTTPISQ